MSNITKTGDFIAANFIEPYMELSDGSKWQMLLFHEVKNGTNLFTSANAPYNNTKGLWSRLKWIDLFTYNNKYEFYVIQDGVTHRWTQTNAPYTTTAVTGFTNISGTVRSGICKANASYGCLAITNTTTWWNCCGAYQSYTTGGVTGVPGFGPNNASGICQDYLILYARIDKPKAFIEKTNAVNGDNIYEY